MALEEVGRPQVATTEIAVTSRNATTEDGRVEAPPERPKVQASQFMCTGNCTVGSKRVVNPTLSATYEMTARGSKALQSAPKLPTASTYPSNPAVVTGLDPKFTD
jgi:hypothetical protein